MTTRRPLCPFFLIILSFSVLSIVSESIDENLSALFWSLIWLPSSDQCVESLKKKFSFINERYSSMIYPVFFLQFRRYVCSQWYFALNLISFEQIYCLIKWKSWISNVVAVGLFFHHSFWLSQWSSLFLFHRYSTSRRNLHYDVEQP